MEEEKNRSEAPDCEWLTTLRGRMRGLLAREPDERWHVLVPCRDVHTFGMAHELDIAFLDRSGKVIAAYRGVGRNRRLRCRAAAATVERFARGDPWLEAGERLALAPERTEPR